MDNIYLDIKDLIYFQERFPNKDFISISDLISDYESLIDDVSNLKTVVENMEHDIQENYEPIPIEKRIL